MFILGCQSAPTCDRKITNMCPKTSSEKRHVPRRQLLIDFAVFCPLWTLKILRKRTTIDTKHMFAFFIDNRLQTQNIDKQRPKKSPKNAKMSQNLSSKIFVFLARFLGSFWRRKCPKNDSKMTPKSAQMAPLGAQGGAWGGHGTPKMPLCRPNWGAFWDPK